MRQNVSPGPLLIDNPQLLQRADVIYASRAQPADTQPNAYRALPSAAIAGIGGLAALAGGAAKSLDSIAAGLTEDDIL